MADARDSVWANSSVRHLNGHVDNGARIVRRQVADACRSAMVANIGYSPWSHTKVKAGGL